MKIKTSNLRKMIQESIIRHLMNEESGYYPSGAEFDSSAPYNQTTSDIDAKKPDNVNYSSLSDFDKMNYDLSEYGDVKVIKNESDEEQVVLVMPKTIEPSVQVSIAKYMRTWWGLHVYDVDEHGGYKIITLVKQDRDESQMDDDFDEYAKYYM